MPIRSAAPAADEAAALKRGGSDRNRRALDAENIGELFLGQGQMAALMAACRRVEQDPAQAAFHAMDRGAGDELPGLDQQGFDMLVNRHAQIGGMIEQFAVARGADPPGGAADLHERSRVAQPASAGLKGAESAVAAHHPAADAFPLDAFRSHADQRIVREPDPEHFRAGFLQDVAPIELDAF